MTDWITLQETADKIGIRKGTLSMWRNRKKFPFKTKGKGRSLMVDGKSVDAWMAEQGDAAPRGRRRKGKRASAGRRRGAPAGRPRSMSRRGAYEIVIQGALNLETIHRFVNDVKSGANVEIAPAGNGYLLRTV